METEVHDLGCNATTRMSCAKKNSFQLYLDISKHLVLFLRVLTLSPGSVRSANDPFKKKAFQNTNVGQIFYHHWNWSLVVTTDAISHPLAQWCPADALEVWLSVPLHISRKRVHLVAPGVCSYVAASCGGALGRLCLTTGEEQDDMDEEPGRVR